jgi:hypothetical protein
MISHAINDLDNFVCGWYNPNLELCDRIIDYHKNSNYRHNGYFGSREDNHNVDKSIKDSIDCQLVGEMKYEYISYLKESFDLYVEKYPYCNNYGSWDIREDIMIQHYKPHGGFKVWHTERGGAQTPSVSRHMTWITYLNDVEDEGGTEFFHQKIKVKAEKGLTIVFPTDWTFTHKGVPSPTEEKWIVTGWWSYV